MRVEWGAAVDSEGTCRPPTHSLDLLLRRWGACGTQASRRAGRAATQCLLGFHGRAGTRALQGLFHAFKRSHEVDSNVFEPRSAHAAIQEGLGLRTGATRGVRAPTGRGHVLRGSGGGGGGHHCVFSCSGKFKVRGMAVAQASTRFSKNCKIFENSVEPRRSPEVLTCQPTN